MTTCISNKQHLSSVEQYFVCQNNSNAEGLIKLFSHDSNVYNVNFPPVTGHDGIHSFAENLYQRTSSRSFDILDYAEHRNMAMAHWEVKMTFRKGVKIGSYELANDFDVNLQGVNKFVFNSEGEIEELRIYHETTTVGQLAKENSV